MEQTEELTNLFKGHKLLYLGDGAYVVVYQNELVFFTTDGIRVTNKVITQLDNDKSLISYLAEITK